MLRNIVTVGVFAVLNVLACIGIWATAVVLGNQLWLGVAEGAMMITLAAVSIVMTLKNEGQIQKAK